MRTRLSFLAICSLLLGLLSTSTPANSLTANLEVIAVTDSKPGEVELTFFSRIAAKSLSSYQITAKPKSGVDLTFSKTYTKKVSGYISQKISPLTPGVDYIFTITATTNKNKLIKSAPYNYLLSSTVPSTPLITKVEATDADEAVVFFVAPKDDGGTPIYYYTATSNPGAISAIAPIQGSGSVTITGLTKATTYTFTLTAHNINGSSKAATSPAPITTFAEKIIRVSSSSTSSTVAAPAFTLSSSSQSVIVNYTITTVTNTSTGGAIASYAISPAAPAGLTFSTSTGQLSGIPTSTQSATAYTITATNAAGSATRTFTLTVTSAAPAFSLSSTTETKVVTTAITGYTITSTGYPITSYSLAGTLPTGLSFSTSNGLITGTPTETITATTYTVIGTSASGETATATYRLRVTGDIGDTGPGGGTIYYYLAAGFSCGPTRAATCKYLEAAPSGWGGASEPGREWANATYALTRVNNASSPETATATGIGWGYRNTRAIMLQGNVETGTVAAALADAYSVTVAGVVVDDWYLPSKDELNQMCKWQGGFSGTNLTNLTTACNAASVTPNSGRGAAGFISNYYWSSTENSSNNAYWRHFSFGTEANNGKGNNYQVRAIRAF